MSIDTSTLEQFLVWIVGGGGCATLTYLLMENVAELAELQPKLKRFASLMLAVALSILAFGAAVGLSYYPSPDGWQGWLESLFAVSAMAFVAIGGSQGLHGKNKL